MARRIRPPDRRRMRRGSRGAARRHVNPAIACIVWRHGQVTVDMELLSFCGAEMFLEISQTRT